jgi:hypothetical protein
LKKRTKKLFSLARAAGESRHKGQKFFASFFKKEDLSSLAYATNRPNAR